MNLNLFHLSKQTSVILCFLPEVTKYGTAIDERIKLKRNRTPFIHLRSFCHSGCLQFFFLHVSDSVVHQFYFLVYISGLDTESISFHHHVSFRQSITFCFYSVKTRGMLRIEGTPPSSPSRERVMPGHAGTPGGHSQCGPFTSQEKNLEAAGGANTPLSQNK